MLARTSILRWPRTIPVGPAGVILLLMPVVALAVSARYLADDYCFGALIGRNGALGAQLVEFQDWSGRFAATAAMTVADLPGPGGAPLVPVLLAVLVPIMFAWALRPITALAVGPVLFLALVAASPEPLQVFAWPTGSATYLLPLVPLAGLAGFELRGRRGLFLPFFLAAIGAGANETFACGLAAALIVMALASRRPTLASAAFGALVGIGIDALAPGNAVRAAQLPRPELLAVPGLALSAMLFVLSRLAVTPAPVVAFALGALVRLRMSNRALTVTWLTVTVLVYSAMVPAAALEGSAPPPRAWVLPDLALLVALGLSGCWIASRRPLPRRLTVAVLSTAIVVACLSIGLSAAVSRSGASAWHLDGASVGWVAACMSDYARSH